MKLSKKIIVALILAILIIMLDIIYLKTTTKVEDVNQEDSNKKLEEEKIEKANPEEEIINELKQENGATANNELYEVQVEYDGKKVLNIKPEIQYKIAFAGIMKSQIPLLEEIDKVFKNEYPKNTGIWIEPNSQQQFLELLKNNTNNKYGITEQGYLEIIQEINPNEQDKVLNKMINSNRQYIITISGTYYEADSVTGVILDNFFEDMDPYQASKIVAWNNNIIMFLSTNKEKKLTNKDILEELIAYGK